MALSLNELKNPNIYETTPSCWLVKITHTQKMKVAEIRMLR